MTKELKTCTPETDLSAVANSMWMRDCGVLPVVDGKGQVVGMITDRDVCIATGYHRRDPATILVRDVMTGNVYSCSPETDLREALRMMQRKQVRRLPVIDSAGKLRGVLSLDDVARKIQPDAKAPEPCARDVHAVLRSLVAHHGMWGGASGQPQTRIQPEEAAV